ncbi:hypothetical protein PsYK624_161340 [Phanerochaete sordida]|uniref:Uncharacterized protein n=1 Tax=Phanerochaete sordida TaxID=48140 RepID=A0A9P3GQF6_9APHY|nr:hypothetical protein PsYK624_161340 [Phanerochaete sordida]
MRVFDRRPRAEDQQAGSRDLQRPGPDAGTPANRGLPRSRPHVRGSTPRSGPAISGISLVCFVPYREALAHCGPGAHGDWPRPLVPVHSHNSVDGASTRDRSPDT